MDIRLPAWLAIAEIPWASVFFALFVKRLPVAKPLVIAR
jgi:hypothetical protein